jgi:hypothetical protein
MYIRIVHFSGTDCSCLLEHISFDLEVLTAVLSSCKQRCHCLLHYLQCIVHTKSVIRRETLISTLSAAVVAASLNADVVATIILCAAAAGAYTYGRA